MYTLRLLWVWLTQVSSRQHVDLHNNTWKRWFKPGVSKLLCQRAISYYKTAGGPDILRNTIVSGYVTFYQINKCFEYIIFLLTKCLCGRVKWLRGSDGMAQQTGFSLRAVVWRPCLKRKVRFKLKCVIHSTNELLKYKAVKCKSSSPSNMSWVGMCWKFLPYFYGVKERFLNQKREPHTLCNRHFHTFT